jgi:serine O-acetyltransferase
MHNTQQFLRRLQEHQHLTQVLPSKAKAHRLVDDIIAFLFPIRMERGVSVDQTEVRLEQLKLQLHESLLPLVSRLATPLGTVVDHFFLELPAIYEELLKDAETIEKFDPAATSVEEVIVAYPGFYAIAVHRLAHQAVKL